MFTEAAIYHITNERMRQVNEEGWSLEHDDSLKGGELARAAACYAMPSETRSAMIWNVSLRFRMWPWSEGWWKPTPDDRIRELTKAGALVAAEISRLLREKAREGV